MKLEDGSGLDVKFDFGTSGACSEECRKKFNMFNGYAQKSKWRFLGLVLLVSIIGVAVTFIRMEADNGALGLFICLAGLGAAIYKYPFATPQTVVSYGGERAIRFAKRVSIYLIISGVLFGFLAYLFG